MSNETKMNSLSKQYCFIDFDGTVADSLQKVYNHVLDAIFQDKLTPLHYIEYYRDFGDAYNIIPGSPWRNILQNLTKYLSTPRANSFDIDDAELGEIDAAMLAAFDAYPAKRKLGYAVPVYESYNAVYIVVTDNLNNEQLIAEVCSQIDSSRCLTVLVKTEDMFVSNEDNIDRILDYESVFDILTDRFNYGAVELLSSGLEENIGIEPVIMFCKQYKELGGKLIIHSGSNEIIVKKMIDILDLENYFDDILCSDMLNVDQEVLGDWGYKTELLGRLLGKYPLENDFTGFVVGDTKGDGFGALDMGLPFLLVWRGYPKDPSVLKGNNGSVLEPDGIVDCRQELIDSGLSNDESQAIVNQMLEFAYSLQ